MPVCVECGYPITRLYQSYGKQNIVLTKCDNCYEFADKYLEHDTVVMAIDMLLHKPQVYRHLLFNQLDYCERGLPPPVYKLAILYVLFDIYIKWFQVEHYCQSIHCNWISLPPLTQYLHILLLSLIEQITYHATIRGLVWWTTGHKYAIFKYNYISMALIVSGFGKLLLIIMVIWNYNELQYCWLLTILVLTSNLEALKAFLHKSGLFTATLILSGWAMKVLVTYLMANHLLGSSQLFWKLVVT